MGEVHDYFVRSRHVRGKQCGEWSIGIGSKVRSSLNEDLQQQLLAAKLPSLPAVAIELLGLAGSASASIAQLAEIVGNDPAISAALLNCMLV